MDLHSLLTDASRAGWTSAVLARLTARLEKALGLWIYRVNIRQLGQPARHPDRQLESITVRLLTEADLLEGAKDDDMELEPAFIRSALARGDLSWGAFEEGKLVGYTWRSPSVAPFRDDLWIRIGHPLHYVYKSYTRTTHRGKGIHIAITRVADQHMLEMGRPAEVGFIDISNIQSLRAARSLGRHKVGWAGYLKLLGRCFTFRTPGVAATRTQFFVSGAKPADVQPSAAAKVAVQPEAIFPVTQERADRLFAFQGLPLRCEAGTALRRPAPADLRDDPDRAVRADHGVVHAVARELDVEVDLVRPGGDRFAKVPGAVVPL